MCCRKLIYTHLSKRKLKKVKMDMEEYSFEDINSSLLEEGDLRDYMHEIYSLAGTHWKTEGIKSKNLFDKTVGLLRAVEENYTNLNKEDADCLKMTAMLYHIIRKGEIKVGVDTTERIFMRLFSDPEEYSKREDLQKRVRDTISSFDKDGSIYEINGPVQGYFANALIKVEYGIEFEQSKGLRLVS